MIRQRNAFLPRVTAALFLVVIVASGCNQTVLPMPGADGNTSAATVSNQPPSFNFDTPTDTVTVRDDSTYTIRYTATTDRPMTARIVIDADGDPLNGNEYAIATNQQIAAPGASGSVDFVAGRFPYGKYFVRATLSDGSENFTFNTLGAINVVPLINNVTPDNNDGLTALSDVGGMRLLYTTGSPGPINSRVPFVATWNYPDFRDKLDPIFIAPFEVNQPVEVRRLQFYTYGHPAADMKHVEIYQGTDRSTTGTLMRQIDQDVASFETGGWNLVTVDPPMLLAPGKYGISFHGHFEFSDNWAGNAAKGNNYAWISPYYDTPYHVTNVDELGFQPNFTFRVIGHLVPETTNPSPNSRLVIPTPLDPVYPDNGSKPPEGLGSKNEDIDVLGGGSPFHVTWQLAR